MEISKDILQWKEAADPIMFVVFSHLALIAEEFKVSISPRKLAEQAGLGYQVVRTALRKMENEGVITQEVTQGKTLVTIWKYIELSNNKKKKSTQKATQKKKDLYSFVLPEHLELWCIWLKYRSSIRKQFANTEVAQLNYKKLIEMSTVTVTDYQGIQTRTTDVKRMKAIIENTIANQYQALVAPKNYGNNSNYNNSGRTTQQDAERIAAQHLAQAAQPSLSAEENRRRIEEELRLFEQAQQC